MTTAHVRSAVRSSSIAFAIVVGACASGPSAATPSLSAPPDGSLHGLVATYRGDDARTGRMPGPGPTGTPAIAWQIDAGGPFSNSPVVADGTVFAVSGEGVVHALDLATGSSRWERDLGTRIDASPVIVDDLLIVADEEGGVTALRRADGEPVWTAELDDGVGGTPATVGGDLVVGTQDGGVVRLRADDGSVVWEIDTKGPIGRSVAATDVAAYVGAGGDLVALDLVDGRTIWRTTLASEGGISTPTVADGMVFAAAGLDSDLDEDRAVSAVDAATGAVRWRYASPDGSGLYTPAVRDDRAYVIGHDQRVVALDTSTGTPTWSIDMGREVEALPAIVGDELYVIANDGPVAGIDVASGERRWEVPVDGIPFGPTVVDGYLLVGTQSGVLYAIAGS